MDDKVLENLSPFLKSIVRKQVEDVRILIKNFRLHIEEALEKGKVVPDFSTLDLIDL